MIHSMTGFARHEARGPWGALSWELRTVNHRYLEVSLRLPEELRPQEQAFREQIAARLARGKLDATLRLDNAAAPDPHLNVNLALAREVARAAGELAGVAPDAAPLRLGELLRWPGVVQEAPLDAAPLQTAAMAALDAALAELHATRAREGERIAALLEERAAAIDAIVRAVRARLPEVLAGVRAKLLGRLAELDVQADAPRLEQELAIIAQKLDVAEELDRLDGHVSELRAIIGRGEPVGRRLDFLMQELNREANTLGSKSQDAQTTKAAMELKVLIEQLREQIQNVE